MIESNKNSVTSNQVITKKPAPVKSLLTFGLVAAIGLSGCQPDTEDGIRDSSTSRGLGDVYKRQVQYHRRRKTYHLLRYSHSVGSSPVSYTHLTLPTICSV